MNIYKYKNYNEYIECQKDATTKKFEKIWVCREELLAISDYLKVHNKGIINFGICHGVRNGYEVGVFGELLGAKVIGTEISELASDKKDVVIWDFNKRNEEWVGACDFVYTNALDHSFNPVETIDTWMEQLSPNGLLFIEWTRGHRFSKKTNMKVDCFLATFLDYKNLLSENGKIVRIINRNVKALEEKGIYIFVVKRK